MAKPETLIPIVANLTVDAILKIIAFFHSQGDVDTAEKFEKTLLEADENYRHVINESRAARGLPPV